MPAAAFCQAELFPFGLHEQERGEGPALRLVAPPSAEEATLEFVTDETAEPGDVLSALADLLIDIAKQR
jgi:hypothetical protein